MAGAVVNVSDANLADVPSLERRKHAPKTGEKDNVLKVVTGHCAVADDDLATSTYRLLRLPAGARIISLRLLNTALTSGTDYDIGLYTTGDGAVVLADAYATSLDLHLAGDQDIAFSARTIDEEKQRVFTDAGDADDSAGFYDLVATANTPSTAAGFITAICEYVFDQ